jgi:hypothetical protein
MAGSRVADGARRTAAEGPTVVNVRVAVPPLLVTVTGLVLPKEQVGAGVTAGEMLQESVTLPVYPLVEAMVTVDCEVLPWLIVACAGAAEIE